MEEQTGRRRHLIVAIVLCLTVGIYLLFFIDRGWIPHDEGVLNHTAERVLRGELPHRDFDDPYTGGLAFLHAAAFRILGTGLLTTRIVLLGVALAMVLLTYSIAIRAGSVPAAVITTLLAAAWSVPNYFAALPSWYVLALSLAGVLALLKHIEDGRRRWLVAAGLCGGIAILFKIVGLYYVAAVLLFLFYRRTSDSEPGGPRGTLLLPAGLSVAVMLLLIGLLVRRHLGPMEFLHHLLPGLTLGAALLYTERTQGRGTLSKRLGDLLRDATPFCAGVGLPVVGFVVLYAVSGNLEDLFHGVIVLPLQRLQEAYFAVPTSGSLLAVAVPVGLLALAAHRGRRLERLLLLPVAAGGVVLLVLSHDPGFYRAVWLSIRAGLPAATLAGCLLIVTRIGTPSAERRQQVFLLFSVAALGSLIQYPYAFAIYFCYFAPIAILAVHFVLAAHPAAPRRLAFVLASFYLLFAVGWLHTGSIRALGSYRLPLPSLASLSVRGSGLRVPVPDRDRYRSIVELVHRHTEQDSYIYAAPDCPEIYFLADRLNPSGTLYDFFEVETDRVNRILRMLDEFNVTVVVINMRPEFSKKIHPELKQALMRKYPRSERIDHFVVAWK